MIERLPTPTAPPRTPAQPAAATLASDDLDLDADATGPLVDRFGRVHRDLRISLTDRCSLRCTYCMPAEGVPWIAKANILSTPELERVARVVASLGIEEVRLTGGEPLLRPDAVDVVRRMAAIEGADGPLRVSITTNGLRLPELMDELVDAGLERVNISIDTLDRDRFAALTRRDRLNDVLAGIEAARRSGLRPLKLNAVLLRDVNDDEAVDLLRFAIANDAELRFIERHLLDAGHTWTRDGMIERHEILERLDTAFTLTPLDGRGAAPAETFLVDGGPHRVGVIASVTAPFCGDCDRVRLTADGQIRNCLFARDEHDLVPLLRGDADDAAIARLVRRAITGKRAGHGIDDPGFLQPDRPMSAIGG